MDPVLDPLSVSKCNYSCSGKIYCCSGKIYCSWGKIYCCLGKIYCSSGKIYCCLGKIHFCSGKFTLLRGNLLLLRENLRWERACTADPPAGQDEGGGGGPAGGGQDTPGATGRDLRLHGEEGEGNPSINQPLFFLWLREYLKPVLVIRRGFNAD